MRAWRAWTTSEVRRLRAMAAAGIGTSAVAHMLGRATSSVIEVAAENRIQLRSQRFSADDIARIRDLGECGLPSHVIAAELDRRSPQAVRRVLRLLDVGRAWRRSGEAVNLVLRVTRETRDTLAVFGRARGMTAARVGACIVESTVKHDLIGAVLDLRATQPQLGASLAAPELCATIG